MRDLGPEVRRRISEDSVGKVIASMEWDDQEHYWVMTFESGEELCVRLMAELVEQTEGDSEDRIARDRRLLAEAVSLLMAVDTVGWGQVEMPEGWFEQSNALLSEYRPEAR